MREEGEPLFTSDSSVPKGFNLWPHVEAFASLISRGPLNLAVHRSKRWAKPNQCFENAIRQAELKGGRALFGWMFVSRQMEDMPELGYLIAVHHAVWCAPRGQPVDITPHSEPKHRPLMQGDSVLFLVDENTRFVPAGSNVRPWPSKFYALDADERLAVHVRLLREAEDGRHAQG